MESKPHMSPIQPTTGPSAHLLLMAGVLPFLKLQCQANERTALHLNSVQSWPELGRIWPVPQ